MSNSSIDSLPSSNSTDEVVDLESQPNKSPSETVLKDSSPEPSLEATIENMKINNGNIVADQPRTIIHYTREELLALKSRPQCKEWPKGLDLALQKQPTKLIDLDKFMKNVQDTGKSSPLDINASDRLEEPRKSRDPRERIRQEEQDGISLSPQRRSFGTGCRVPNQLMGFSHQRRPESPADIVSQRDTHREMPTRRIGSGRIMRREEQENHYERDPREQHQDPRRNPRDWRTKNDAKNDKRRRYYEDERRQPHERPDHRDRRYDNRHHMDNDTPEWFTGGPSSQKDCIELVGFDDVEDGKENWKKEIDDNKKKASRSPTPQPDPPKVVQDQTPSETPSTNPVVIEPCNEEDSMSFNIENIIMGNFLNIGTDDSPTEGTSRMKQFFQQVDTADNQQDSQNDIQSQLQRMGGSCELVPPSRSTADNSHYFAPIAPASNVNSIGGELNLPKELQGSHDAPSVQDLLLRGRGHNLQDIEAELKNQEPKNMQNSALNDFLSRVAPSATKPPQQQDNNILAKLMNGSVKDTGSTNRGQAFRQPALPNAPTENELIALMMKNADKNISNQAQINQNRNPIGRKPMPSNNPISMPCHQDVPSSVGNYLAPPQVNHEMLLKLQHKKTPQLLHPGFQGHTDPIKKLMGGIPMNNSQPQNSFIQNEVHNLVHYVATGHMTPSQLMAQLSNPNLQMHQREAIVTVLKILHSSNPNALLGVRNSLTPSPTAQTGAGLQLGTTPMNLSPRVASPNPEASNVLHAPHMMPQRVSPLMFNATIPGNPRRPPSQQELIAHTQSIHMKALLKEKLEKAKEKHRKEETERIKSPNLRSLGAGHPMNIMRDPSPVKHTMKSQSPLAFTPTSVMRKMTADRDRNDKGAGQGGSDNLRHAKPMGTSHNQGLTPFHDHGLQVPPMGNGAHHRTSPISLANIFGRDIVAQAQGGQLPDLPGQVLSLEEVERLQQNQANTADFNQYKYVR